VKQLSVTYAYCSPNSIFDYHVQVVQEGESIHIPLQQPNVNVKLTIHAAYWADMDVTDVLRSQISSNQTLRIESSLVHPYDPWYNVLKTLSIMYQYTDGPLQLLVCDDRTGVIFISPTSPLERNFFNPDALREDKINILAVIWGAMQNHPEPLDASQLQWIAEKGRFPCSNEWFGFDGRMNWPKSCHVFYRFGTTGNIRCKATREGKECRLDMSP
jgi:hypothetical protein